MLLARLLRKLIRHGRLTIVDACGNAHELGGEPLAGVSPVCIRLHDRALHHRLVAQPALAVGEAFMEGTLTIETGDVYDLIALSMANLERDRGPLATWFAGGSRWLRRFHQFNPVGLAHRNVAHHYDLSHELYSLFLDRDLQYSCAYFDKPGTSLEAAQEAKKRHLAAKLLLLPGQRVLDIGCGWGGLGLALAQEAKVEVTGITLSEEQLKVARRRAEEAQLPQCARFELSDYRHVEGRFDRIVSVGMFEHVGINHYGTFFAKVRDLLADNGVALLHTIGRSGRPACTNPWMRKYIFPGGYIPALSEVVRAVERSGLVITDIEILRTHYAETLREWRRRFRARWEEAARLYDERFCRMWDFYLAGSEAAFRHQGLVVFQIQMAKRADAVPRTRDYVGEWERSAKYVA